MRMGWDHRLGNEHVIVAMLLAQRGWPVELGLVAQVAADTAEHESVRTDAIRALGWFKGESTRKFLVGLLGVPQLAEVRATTIKALRWYDDDATVAIMLSGLGDPDSYVREAAMQALAHADPGKTVGLLQALVDSGGDEQVLNAARVLQFLGVEVSPALFQAYLESDGMSAGVLDPIRQAVNGLRDALGRLPDSAAMTSLQSPSRNVRIAAMLALADRKWDASKLAPLQLLSEEAKDPARHAAMVALWAIRMTERIAGLADEVDLAMSNGETERARQLHDLLTDPYVGFWTTFHMGLSIPKQVGNSGGRLAYRAYPRDLYHRVKLLEARIQVAEGWDTRAIGTLESLLGSDPRLRQATQNNPDFAALHGFYAFRVLTGMQLPSDAEDPRLPEMPGS